MVIGLTEEAHQLVEPGRQEQSRDDHTADKHDEIITYSSNVNMRSIGVGPALLLAEQYQ